MYLTPAIPLFALSILVAAQPTLRERNPEPELDIAGAIALDKGIFEAIGWRWTHSQAPGFEPTCDLSQAKMPASELLHHACLHSYVRRLTFNPATRPLPAPNGTLAHVAIGRGTQNYTCDLTNSTAVPVPVGALARLYNASCIAALWPDYLSLIPLIALELSLPTDASAPLTGQNIYLSGNHFFTNATCPVFNLDTANNQYGRAAVKKVVAVPAPPRAPAGQYNQGFGSVAWLYLTANTALGPQSFQEVYRVNTAGGQPPGTCAGQSAAFEVQYAAEYWFYA